MFFYAFIFIANLKLKKIIVVVMCFYLKLRTRNEGNEINIRASLCVKGV